METRKGTAEASVGVNVSRVLSCEIGKGPRRPSCQEGGRQHRVDRHGKVSLESGAVGGPARALKQYERNREPPCTPGNPGRSSKGNHTGDTYGTGSQTGVMY